MGKVLDYLVNELGCVLAPSPKVGGMEIDSNEIRTKDGDYVGLDDLVEKRSVERDIIYEHKLTDIQAVDKGSGCTVQLGFNEKEQAWYGWTHRGWGSFKVGQEIKEGTVVTGSSRFPVKAGFVCKTLEDCKYCAKAIADALD